MKIWVQIIEILLLGAIGGAVPGPILTAVFTEVLNGGFKKSLSVVFRAFIAEALVAVSILLIVFSLSVPPLVFHAISFAGALYLIWIASRIWKIEKIHGEGSELFSFSKILLLTVLNGGFWIFWLSICVPRSFALKEQIIGGQYMFLIVFELGWVIVTALLAFVFSRFRPLLLKKNLVSTVFKVFALLLIFFALKSIVQSSIFLAQYFN